MTNHKSFKFSISGFLLQKQFRRNLILFIMCLLLTTTIVYFYNYNKITLLRMGQWDLKKIEYEDMARSKKWDEVIAQTGDNFIMKMFSNKDALVNHQLFGYATIMGVAVLAGLILSLIHSWQSSSACCFHS